MSNLKTISADASDMFRLDIESLCKLEKENLQKLLDFLDSGNTLIDYAKNDEIHIIDDRICDILEISPENSQRISRVILNIARKNDDKEYQQGIIHDAKQLLPQMNLENLQVLQSKLVNMEISKSIQNAEERRSMASGILPNLSEISFCVDIRCNVEDNKVINSVPIVIMSLETTNNRQRERINFQITESMAREIIDVLEKELSKIDILKNGIPKDTFA